MPTYRHTGRHIDRYAGIHSDIQRYRDTYACRYIEKHTETGRRHTETDIHIHIQAYTERDRQGIHTERDT